MSTDIIVFPSTAYLPLIEETRHRTQELYQLYLDQHNIRSTIEVRAFYPSEHGDIKYVAHNVRWEIEMYLGFAYWVNGKWAASSWPSLMERERINEIDVEFYEQYGPEDGYPASMLGELPPIDKEFQIPIPDEEMKLFNAQDHFWCDTRNIGGHAVSSIGYGFVAAALAEATNGRIMSDDGAFNIKHNGETAEQFLTWWGDEQLAWYGTSRFCE